MCLPFTFYSPVPYVNQVNIREYYLRSETQGVATKAKSFAPSFKGTTLDPNQWNVLKNAARDVDEMISQMT